MAARFLCPLPSSFFFLPSAALSPPGGGLLSPWTTLSRSGSLKNTDDRRGLGRKLCRFFTPPCAGQISAARGAGGLSSGCVGGGVRKGSDLGVSVAVLVMGEELDSHVHGLFGSALLTFLLLLLPSVKSKLRFKNENMMMAVKNERGPLLAVYPVPHTALNSRSAGALSVEGLKSRASCACRWADEGRHISGHERCRVVY